MSDTVDPDSLPDNWIPDDEDDDEEDISSEHVDTESPPPPRRSRRQIVVARGEPSGMDHPPPEEPRYRSSPSRSPREQWCTEFGVYGAHADAWATYERALLSERCKRPIWETRRGADGTLYQRREGVSAEEVEPFVRATEAPTRSGPSNEYSPRKRYSLDDISTIFAALIGRSRKWTSTYLRKRGVVRGGRRPYVCHDDLVEVVERLRRSKAIRRSERKVIGRMDANPDRTFNWLDPVLPIANDDAPARRDLKLQPVTIGEVFTRLTVIGPATRHPKYGQMWACLCSCGTTKVVRQDRLISGDSKSCGCLKAEENRAHYARHLRRRAPLTAADEVREIWAASGSAPRRK